MTTVSSKLFTPDGSPIEGREVVARLVTPSSFLDDSSGEVTSSVCTRTDVDGNWEFDLTPQSEYAATDTFYLIDDSHDVHYVVVPDTGPVLLADILVDPGTLDPTPPTTTSLYVPRAEVGEPDGVAPLDENGLVPEDNLPVGSGGTGVTDHGDLTGLGDDDHTQYLNEARGDTRYYTQGQVDTALSGKANTVHTHAISDVIGLQTALDDKEDDGTAAAAVAAHVAEPDPHPVYQLESELQAALSDTPRFLHYDAGWPARGTSPRLTFFIGGSESADQPTDLDTSAGDVWIPETT